MRKTVFRTVFTRLGFLCELLGGDQGRISISQFVDREMRSTLDRQKKISTFSRNHFFLKRVIGRFFDFTDIHSSRTRKNNQSFTRKHPRTKNVVVPFTAKADAELPISGELLFWYFAKFRTIVLAHFRPRLEVRLFASSRQVS